MSKMVSIMIDVVVDDDVDPDRLASSVFDFLASDPENIFPAIETVDSYDWKLLD